MSILLQKKNVGDYSYMSSPNIYYRAKINIEKASRTLVLLAFVYRSTCVACWLKLRVEWLLQFLQ